MTTDTALFNKYDVPVPRYTSYPTVPSWDISGFNPEKWFESVSRIFEETNERKGISLYIHLPFCESLCTYCACNTRITKNHNTEIPYIQSVLKEWAQYTKLFKRRPIIRELHLGGGTPTFFSSKNLEWLVSYLLEDADLHNNFQMSFEGHPNNTTYEHLTTLYRLGARRVSFGVQDLDDQVQKAIHRVQPFENLERVTRQARLIGYNSVGFDLIYGLPHQTPFTVSDTIDKVLLLRPDRVAFYSYAHVPWIRPGQRGYDERDLPSRYLKRHLYDLGKHKLKQQGYTDIGMDHFALPKDELFKAQLSGKLHRNFMGYTTEPTDLLIGLGASAISDSHYGYAQNVKDVEAYRDKVSLDGDAINLGHMLSDEDIERRNSILELTCRGQLNRASLERFSDDLTFAKLTEMEREGLIDLSEDGLFIRTKGQPFLRNICHVFDTRQPISSNTPTFSKSI